MGKRIPPDVVATEAETLKRLLGERNRSDFGASLSPKRSRSEIHQHENGTRPIPLEAARSYADALGVKLSEISKRWADQISGPQQRHKPARKLVQRLCDLAETINDLGLMYLIGKAEEVAKTEPLAPKKPHGKAA